MQPRMRNPALIVPDAMTALLAVGKASEKSGLPATTLAMAHLRASQINGCSVCVDMHARELKKAGATDEQIHSVSAWRETPYFNEAERAALALTESMTRLSDREDPVPDSVWDAAKKQYDELALASLVLAIAIVNTWNRLNAATKQIAGRQPR